MYGVQILSLRKKFSLVYTIASLIENWNRHIYLKAQQSQTVQENRTGSPLYTQPEYYRIQQIRSNSYLKIYRGMQSRSVDLHICDPYIGSRLHFI